MLKSREKQKDKPSAKRSFSVGLSVAVNVRISSVERSESSHNATARAKPHKGEALAGCKGSTRAKPHRGKALVGAVDQSGNFQALAVGVGARPSQTGIASAENSHEPGGFAESGLARTDTKQD